MLLEAYVADLERRGKGEDTVKRAASTAKMVERVTPALLDMPVSAIGDAEVFAFLNARARDGRIVYETVAGKRQERRIPNKPGTINRDLRTLRAALKKARPEYRFPAGAFFPQDDTRVRWLRPEEEVLVLEPMPSPFREMAKLAALTLMRQGEILSLRPEYVHLEQGAILLPRAKGGARAVILNGEAQKILQSQMEKHQGSDWVFPNLDGVPYSRIHVSRVFRKAARAAGLKDFRFHDLRHHGATMALTTRHQNSGFSAAC
jgi:integrase